MGALAKLFSYSDKILAAFFLKILPEILWLIILAICIMWKYYKVVVTNYKYMATINKKSFKFSYKKKANQESSECSICLSEFVQGEESREIVECRHIFHRHCLERWLKGYTGATCPLCRSLVVPEMFVAEYQMMQIEQENNRVIEKELALILLNALSGGRRSCNNGFF